MMAGMRTSPMYTSKQAFEMVSARVTIEELIMYLPCTLHEPQHVSTHLHNRRSGSYSSEVSNATIHDGLPCCTWHDGCPVTLRSTS
jgi:hypothetical protein